MRLEPIQRKCFNFYEAVTYRMNDEKERRPCEYHATWKEGMALSPRSCYDVEQNNIKLGRHVFAGLEDNLTFKIVDSEHATRSALGWTMSVDRR
jgi:hypothetical protein